MYLNEIIEVVTGIVVVFLTISLACSGLQEILSSILKWRAHGLEEAIRSLLQAGRDANMLKSFESHPLMRSFTPPARTKSFISHLREFVLYPLKRLGVPLGSSVWPSYLPARSFSLILIDLITTAGTDRSVIQAGLQKVQQAIQHPDNYQSIALETLAKRMEEWAASEQGNNGEAIDILNQIKAFAVANLPPESIQDFERTLMTASLQSGVATLKDQNPQLHQILSTLIGQAMAEISGAETRLAEFRKYLEKWFNDGMDRASGWYKRQAVLVMFLAGLCISITLNVDTIQIARALWEQPTLRAALVAQAEKMSTPDIQGGSPEAQDQALQQFQQNIHTLAEVNLPIGWPIPPLSAKQMALKGLGWVITAAAATQGAPFWYDLIMKLTNLRLAGKKPEVEKGG